MITLRRNADEVLCELGGGANPLVTPRCMGGKDVNIDARTCYDSQGRQTTDFSHDFNELPLPLSDNEFAGVVSQFSLEHISFHKVPGFISEMFRILKPGGKVVIVTANLEKQLEWIKNNKEGWDGKGLFEASSELLYGSQDYPENSHRSAFTPAIISQLLSDAGFQNILVRPYNERSTDLAAEAIKPGQKQLDDAQPDSLPPPMAPGSMGTPNVEPTQFRQEERKEEPPSPIAGVPRTEIFDRHYFGGGAKWGGYAREGFWDYPVHNISAQKILARKPESVLEIGAARGYILKRIQDVGIRAEGLEISRHCYLTRVADGIREWDLCNTPWPIPDQSFDLLVSIACLEHIPEQYIPAIASEMARVAKRGLHGIDFGENDDGFDQTHICLRPYSFWRERLPASHEIVDKEELERGEVAPEILKGDGKVKLNVGCFQTQFHHGWTNIDIHDMSQFAAQYKYNFQRCDVRQGLPYPTGSVDLIFLLHMLEHLTQREGQSFLRECRRVIKPDGAMRIVCPDAETLCFMYGNVREGQPALSEFDEANEGSANSPTSAGKIWELLFSGHQMAYDVETLVYALEQAGFNGYRSGFRRVNVGDVENAREANCLSGLQQILRETQEMGYDLSCFVDAVPNLAP